MAYMAGVVGELTGRLTRREPRGSLDGIRMASLPMRYDSSKAVNELGVLQMSQVRLHGHSGERLYLHE